MDVGIKLVEFFDIDIENVAQVGTHGVVEFDGDFASVIAALGNYEVGRGFCFSAGAERKRHGGKQDENKQLFHFGGSFLSKKYLCYKIF